MPLIIPALVLVILTAGIILLGKYKVVEKVTTIVAIVISLAVLAAAVSTKPDVSEISKRFVPKLPADMKIDEVIPWLGFMLAGAAGLMWFSYWTEARGYGAASIKRAEPLQTKESNADERKTLRDWIKHMTIANTMAVIGALIIAFAFLILGTELLKPKNFDS